MSSGWLSRFTDANELASEIDASLKERDQKGLRGEDISQITATTRRKISHIENSAAQLEEDLNIQSRDPITYKVTENEINRREGVLMGLQNRIETFKVKIAQNPSQNARGELMGAGGTKRVWGETAETDGLGNVAVLDLQKKKMKDQDARLGQISRQVGTITQVGNAIHDELDEHHKLLDDIDTKVQKTTIKVHKEANRMDVLRKEATTGSCWCCICILMCIIIVLVIV